MNSRAWQVLLAAGVLLAVWPRSAEAAEDEMAWAKRGYHRVTGCWPVAELKWMQAPSTTSTQKWEVKVTMDTKGNAFAEAPFEGINGRYKVFFGNEGSFILLADVEGDLLSDGYVFHIDMTKRHVGMDLSQYNAEPGESPFRFFPDLKLKGCRKIPTVASKPMPARRHR